MGGPARSPSGAFSPKWLYCEHEHLDLQIWSPPVQGAHQTGRQEKGPENWITSVSLAGLHPSCL